MDSNKNFHGTWLIPTASIVSRLWKFYSWRKRATQFYPYECNSDIREQLYSFISTVSSIVIYRPFENSNIIYILYIFQLLTLYLTSNTVLQLNENGNQECIRAIKQSTEDKRSTSTRAFLWKKKNLIPKLAIDCTTEFPVDESKSLFQLLSKGNDEKTTRKSFCKNQQTN